MIQSSIQYNRGLHVLAVLTAAATFPLIFMGGLVTSHQAGLAVPDWPNSFGYNMFLFPPSQWVGGIFYEHTHRLMGTVVGCLSVALAVVAFVTEGRLWIRWLCAGVLLAVMFQGLLGGLRVVLVKLDLAIIHACVAQAFFCLTIFTVIATSKWWIEADDRHGSDRHGGDRRVVYFAGVAVAAIYLQIIAGAVMRHEQAGLAIPDFPTVFGKLLPPTLLDRAARQDLMRQFGLDMGKVTLFQIWIHFAHRVGAILVSLTALALATHIYLRQRKHPRLVVLTTMLLIVLAGQIVLGAVTVLMRKPADLASLHVAVGALSLGVAFAILTVAFRIYRPAMQSQESPAYSHDDSVLIHEPLPA